MAIKDTQGNLHSEDNGRFVGKDDLTASELKEQLQKELPKEATIVKVNLDADIQKQFDNATPQERSKIAYRYIMDRLRGKYSTTEKREVRIERVGAKEISHTLFEPKIRVVPELGQMIETGNLIDVSVAEHGRFKEFAYYEVYVNIGKDTYRAVLNVGIRENGDSTLYDINQFQKQ